MNVTRTQVAFEKMAQDGTGDSGALAVGLRQNITGLGLRSLAAKMLHVAIAAPERTADVYENAAAGWLSGPVFPPRLRKLDPVPVSDAFWRHFWELMSLPTAARRPVAFTERLLAMAGQLHPEVHRRVAAAAAEWPGVAEAVAGEIPPPPDPRVLAEAPPASLGRMLHQDALARGGGLQVMNRETLRLRELPPPLEGVNARALHGGPVWAIVGGYGPSQLDQIALAGFLMGQFGHHYSSMFAATVMTTVAFDRPPGLELVIDSLLKGWRHGQDTPLLLGVDWETFWRLRLDEVRQALGVTPFDSPFMAALRKGLEPPRRPH